MKKKLSWNDYVGILCAVVLVLCFVVNAVMTSAGNKAAEAAEKAAAEAAAAAKPADLVTVTGSAQGMNGPVELKVEATADKLVSLSVVSQNETQGIGTVALEKLLPQIVENQNINVDAVSGATVTSTAIIGAIKDAYSKAGLDVSVLEGKKVEAAKPVPQDKTYTTNVVVLGAGGAGMTAAIEAKDAGSDVIVLESMSMVGGNSIRSTGGINAAETPYQQLNAFGESAGVEKMLVSAKAYASNEEVAALLKTVTEQWEAYKANPVGYFDSTELFRLDTMVGGLALNDPKLVRTLADDSADAISWLESIGAPMPSVSSFGGASVKRIHRPLNDQGKVVSVGTYIVPILQKNLESRGIELLLSTKAEELLFDKNGKLTGVKATADDGSTVTVYADAVVLATGGFGANKEMVVSYKPELEGFLSTNASGIQGEGIAMAVKAGAATVDMEQIQIHPTVHAATGGLITEGLRGDGAILVNQNGERFYDEVSTRDKVSAAEIAQPGMTAWLVVDGRMTNASSVIQGYITKGMTVTGNTYEELAKAMGVPADTFAATMKKWNGYVAAKNDPDFGRTSFAKPLDEAPYYGILVTPGIHHTMGGVKINEKTEVLNEKGNVIPGLFAAGEVTGGVHGGNRLGGNAVADFVVFGRIAGKQAAAYSKGTKPADTVKVETSAKGMNGLVNLQIEISEQGIHSIKVLGHSETKGIGTVALEKLPQQILDSQSLKVDAISGATVTSNAIKEAIKAGYEKAGLDYTSLENKEAKVEKKATVTGAYTTDVVVLGAGGAGMTAAIEAKDAGKDVIVLESMSMVGGNSIRSTGGINAAETPYQQLNAFGEAAGVEKMLVSAQAYISNPEVAKLLYMVRQQWEDYKANPVGYFDSTELFRLDTMVGGLALNDPKLVKTLADDSADAISWLESIGAPMPSVSSFGGASVKRIHRPLNAQGKVVSVGTYIVPILQSNLESRGIKLLLNTKATDLLFDGSGNACAVRAVTSDGDIVTVYAKAVVLATGGFGANKEMVVSYKPELEGFLSTNASGIQGEGIAMAVKAGAATVDMEQIQIHPTVHAATGGLITEGLRGDGAILVNQNGERFYDEVSTRDKVSAAEIAQPGMTAWLVVDGRMTNASSVIQGYITKGMTVTGNTYEELAKAMGVPADAFAATMKKWNGYVAAKNDPDFGRTSFAKPLDEAPYYGILVTPGIHHTMGGVKINEKTEVLNEKGNVIPGLFAAGEVTGGVHGGNRLGGNAVADFVVFGRIAGKQAAAFADR